MIINNTEFSQSKSRVVIIMSDVAVVAASVKASLSDLSKQAGALGLGLQNAAPGERVGSPNYSVQYLLDISERLSKLAQECNAFLITSPPSAPRI